MAQGACIEGNLKFTDDLRIDGEVIGDISASEDAASILVISEMASVTGRIVAGHVIINGRVMGPAHVSELPKLQPEANIAGDVSYKALEMHQGAIICGQLRIAGHALDEKPVLKLAASSV